MTNTDWEFFKIIGTVIVSSLIFAIVFATLWQHSINQDKNDCEKIGGTYKVVDHTFSGKTEVDVYGCVK